MKRLLNPGRIIFATGMLALGIVCFIVKDFIVGRPPAWPAGFTVNPALAYISATILIVASIAIIIKKYEVQSALIIAALIFLLSILRHIPHFMNDWANAYKSIALFGGSLIIAAAFSKKNFNNVPRFMANEKLLRNLIAAGSVFLASFLIVGGYAHFKYVDFVKTLIPDYIPFHIFWTYFCGTCLLAGGVGLLFPPTRRIAALLCGIMILGWFLLLHIPRFLSNVNDASDRMGVCEAFAFCGIFFVLAATLSKK